MKVSRLVPEVYYRESRDFSYIGRLFEVVFNYMKTGADLVNTNPTNKNVSDEILELAGMTVGFESKHKYIKEDLATIISDFVRLCKNKGSLKAIEEAIQILLTSQKISGKPEIVYNTVDHSINIYVPYQMQDVILLEDIFEYILPVGITYQIYYIYSADNTNTSEVIVSAPSPTLNVTKVDSNLGQVTNGSNTSTEPSGSGQSFNARSIFNTGIVVSK